MGSQTFGHVTLKSDRIESNTLKSGSTETYVVCFCPTRSSDQILNDWQVDFTTLNKTEIYIFANSHINSTQPNWNLPTKYIVHLTKTNPLWSGLP